jgi:hypothetical protein
MRLRVIVTVAAAFACVWFSSAAQAFLVGTPASVAQHAGPSVELVSRRSATTRYHARRAVARSAVSRQATRRAAYRAQTKRYQVRRDLQRAEARRQAVKRERLPARQRVRRGIGY